MLTHPVLLSTAAEIVAASTGLDKEYVLGHARRFVRDDLLKPAQTIGGGANRRAFLDTYGVARLAVISVIQKYALHLGDLASAARCLDNINTEDPDAEFRDFKTVVDEFALLDDPQTSELQWYFHRHIDLLGKQWGSCSREGNPNRIIASIAAFSTRVALRGILLSVLRAMREYESDDA